MISAEKLQTLSAISRDIGQVFFATMFVGPLVNGFVDWLPISFGLLFAFICWMTSFLLTN